MKLNIRDKNNLKLKMFSLMDEVQLNLKKGGSIDDFLDETDLFDDWERIIPEKEYPIFIITILNNIRKESIIDTILDSLSKNVKKKIKFAIQEKTNSYLMWVNYRLIEYFLFFIISILRQF